MKTYFKHATFISTLLGLVLTLNLILPVQVVSGAKPPTKTPTPSGGPTATPTSSGGGAHAHYVDCSLGTNGNGSQASPWNSVTTASAHTYGPGDSLLFKRGATCNGAFVAQGSGSAAAPITIADYGTGAQPIIDGGTTNETTIALTGVEYYNLSNLAVRGGSLWGVRIKASTTNQALHHFYLTNLDISAVNHVALQRNDSGLLGIYTEGTAFSTISDVLVDGVTTHDTTAGAGMTIGGGDDWPCGVCGSNFTVRNSLSHDVYGDGIVLWELNNGLIENNVAYRSGMCPIGACSGSTPVGIWTWNTNGMVIQNNESYGHHTWATAGGDGGGFDVDGDNHNNTLQYNYAHDSEGFCAAVYDFGSGDITSNTVFRYNLCTNNAQRVVGYGEIRVASWQGGRIDSMQIYNNTFYYNPGPGVVDGDTAALRMSAVYTGNSIFKNNILYSNLQRLMRTESELAHDYNLYYTPGLGYQFKLGAATYFNSLSEWQAGTGHDLHSLTAEPKLNGLGYHGVGMPTLANGFYTLQVGSPALNVGTNVCAVSCVGGSMGTRDYFGITLDATHNIGAYEGNGQ